MTRAKFKIDLPSGAPETSVQGRSRTQKASGPFRASCYKLPLLAALLFAPLALHGQSGAATLQGTVTDPNGAVIPGATVVVKDDATGVTRTLTSNPTGFFAAPDLAPGRYSLTVSAAGFGGQSLTGILLTVGGTRDQDVHLLVQSETNVITVTSAEPALDSSTSTLQGLVDGKTTRELPLNGRDFTQLASLQNGVTAVQTQYGSNATSSTRLSRGLGSQLSIGGNRPQQNSYRLDGVNTNDYANGSSGSVSGYILGVDAVQEFSVIQSNAPAAYGRMSGGVINSVTRVGTNDFDGAIYDFVRNSVFDSRKFLDPTPIAPFRRNQFGASLGGPIRRNKTFFFGNYEGLRQDQGQSSTIIVPTALARTGMLVCVPTPTVPCKTTYTQVAVDPNVAPYLALYNLPNVPTTAVSDTANYTFNTQVPTNEDFSTIHLDNTFSDRDSLRGTLLYDTASTTSSDPSNAVLDEAVSRRTTAALEEVHVFSPRLTNALRLGYNRAVAIAPLQIGVVNPAAANTSLGFFPGKTAGSLLVSGLTTFNGGVGGVGTNYYHYNSYQLYDDASFTAGRHSFSFGFAVERDQDNIKAGLLPNGSWSFGSLKNFLTNVPTYFEAGLPATPVFPLDLRSTIYAGYAADDFRIRPNLTLNLGIRYEMNTDVTESRSRLGRLLNVSDAAPTNVNTFFSNNPTLKNFEPRLGLAWDPFANGRTVVHAAGGMYDILPLPYVFGQAQVSSAPVYDEGRNTSVVAKSFPFNGFLNTTPKLRAQYTPSNPGRSYVVQYTLNVQQQISNNLTVTLGYIGSHAVRQPTTSNDINIVQPTYVNGAYIFPAKGTASVLNPNVGTISATYFDGSSIYNSLQSNLKYTVGTRFNGGISYTWSRSIDDTSSALSGASFANSIANPPSFDLRLDRGLSDFDVRHVFNAYAVATLPDPKQRYLAAARGFTLNNIFTIRSGTPFTPIIGGDPLNLLSNTPFAFPDQVSKQNCIRPKTVAYINLSCFAFPAPITNAAGAIVGARLGNAGRNPLQGPGFFSWTTGVQKEQKFGEHLRAQFQAQAFNVTNRTNYSVPTGASLQLYNASGTALSSTAGQLTAAGDARQLQFSLKILY